MEIIDTKISFPLDVNNREELLKIVRSSVGTKFTARLGDLVPNLALDAVQTVKTLGADGKSVEIDIKKLAKGGKDSRWGN